MKQDDTELLTLVNKIVKVRDASNGIDNSGYIPFMYPDFIVKDELFFDYDNNVIIEMKYSPKLKEDLHHATKNFIAICDSGMQDIDFTDRDTIIQVLKDKHKGRFAKDKVELLQNLGEFEFWQSYKKFWVLNTKVDTEGKVGIFDLYKVIGRRKDEVFNVYFKLREIYSDATIYSVLLGFMDKSLHPDKVSTQNGNYLRLLREFCQSPIAEEALIALRECYQMPSSTETERQYRTMFLLNHLGKRDII
jgi:hypothetical protein